jgi:hypothetical protein
MVAKTLQFGNNLYQVHCLKKQLKSGIVEDNSFVKRNRIDCKNLHIQYGI